MVGDVTIALHTNDWSPKWTEVGINRFEPFPILSVQSATAIQSHNSQASLAVVAFQSDDQLDAIHQPKQQDVRFSIFGRTAV